jgi:hypothetical protein
MRLRISYTGIAAALAAIACLLAASASAQTRDNGEAQISGFAPKHAMAGQVVTISGMNLDGTASVAFGKVLSHATAVDLNGAWVRAVVPTGVTPGTVSITLDNGGNPATITGFQVDAGSVPPGNPNFPVTAAAGSSTAKANTKAQPVANLRLAPRITLISPLRGSAGTRVTVSGANLAGPTWLKFGGIRGRITQTSSRMIIALVPKHAHSGKISVHTSGGTGISSQRFVVTGAV